MFSRRTQARVAFLLELLSVSYRFRKLCGKPTDGSNRIAPEWLIFGTAMQIGYNWIYDHDIGAFRTNRWRRVVGIGVGSLVNIRLTPRPEDEWRKYSFTVPRETSLGDLAEQQDISHQALSERLRRATGQLVESTLITHSDESDE